ncbi:MAG: O-antigen ligase family protein [Nitrospirae bacterium]|nr:O-antigen ligase family protein [Nitrospirota bacterium]
MKNFLAIFIYAAFCNNIMDMKKAFKSLLIVTVFLAAIAIFQEVWAMTSYYVLHKDILDKSIYVLAQNLMPEGSWRFGLYRTPSLMFNPNIFSFFLVLVIVIYKNIKEKVNPAVLLVLVIAVIFTGSRIAYIGLVVFAGMQIFKSRRWVLILSTPAAIVIMIVNLFLYTSDMELKNVWKPDLPEMELTGDVKETKIEDATYISFRQYAKTKGIEIWSDKPFWGVGPGMYGGVVSIKTKSHVYSEYSFFEIAKTYAEKWGGIDQFWPQILAELGVMGTGLFIVFLIFISVILDTARHQATSYEMKCLYSGLIICTTVLIMYSASNGINLSSMILVYTGFIGMALGCEDKALTNASWAEASA